MACLVYASDAVALTPREWNFLFGPPSSSCFSFSLQGGLSLRESMQAIQIEYHEQAKETDRRWAVAEEKKKTGLCTDAAAGHLSFPSHWFSAFVLLFFFFSVFLCFFFFFDLSSLYLSSPRYSKPRSALRFAPPFYLVLLRVSIQRVSARTTSSNTSPPTHPHTHKRFHPQSKKGIIEKYSRFFFFPLWMTLFCSPWLAARCWAGGKAPTTIQKQSKNKEH
jgi:hypothetical protein